MTFWVPSSSHFQLSHAQKVSLSLWKPQFAGNFWSNYYLFINCYSLFLINISFHFAYSQGMMFFFLTPKYSPIISPNVRLCPCALVRVITVQNGGLYVASNSLKISCHPCIKYAKWMGICRIHGDVQQRFSTVIDAGVQSWQQVLWKAPSFDNKSMDNFV